MFLRFLVVVVRYDGTVIMISIQQDKLFLDTRGDESVWLTEAYI